MPAVSSHALRANLGLLIGIGLFASAAPLRAQTLFDAITGGTPLLDVRLRYDSVDESDKPKDAYAATVRARAGYRTGSYDGFAALAEFDVLQHIGPRRFNETVDHLTAYPVIQDPDMATVNRLQLDYATRLFAPADAPADTRLVVGRQEIILGNLRFVGNSGWRQHEQTYDAVSLI